MKKNSVYITYYNAASSSGVNCKQAVLSMASMQPSFIFPDNKDKYSFPYFKIPLLNNGPCRASKIAFSLMDNIPTKLFDYQNIKTTSIENKIPLFFASSTGGIDNTEDVYKKMYNDEIKYPLFKSHFFDKIINDIKRRYNNCFSDVCTFSTACSSSGHAILQAFNFIREGIFKKIVILGIDVLSLTTCIGFDSLKLVSHTGCKPLSKKRDGLTLGEGGGIIILESEPVNEPFAEIIGAFSNSDGYHISSPDPEGNSQKKCIETAIKQSGLSPAKIDYINAHGTGTLMNDEIEMNVIKSIFSNVCVTSLKSFVGHTLGASAIIELAISLEMFQMGKIYQPLNFTDPMDIVVPEATIDKKVKYFVKNSFGFGGNNVSLVIKNII